MLISTFHRYILASIFRVTVVDKGGKRKRIHLYRPTERAVANKNRGSGRWNKYYTELRGSEVQARKVKQ
jgi:hypothetical protein